MTITPIQTSTPHPPDCLCAICGTPVALRHSQGPLTVAAISADSVFSTMISRDARVILDGKRRVVAIVLGPDVLSIPDSQMFAASTALLKALEEIDEMARYATEENTGSREEMLLRIGLTARAAIALTTPKGESA